MWQIQYKNEAGQWIAGDGGSATADDATFTGQAEAYKALQDLFAAWGIEGDYHAQLRYRVVAVA